MRAHNDSRTSWKFIWRYSVLSALGVWLGAWLVVAGTWNPAHAQGKPATKITDDLKTLHTEHLVAARSDTARQRSNPSLPVAGDWVTLDAVASGDPSNLAADLLALGAQDIVTVGRVVSARLPIPAIPILDTLASLEFARPAYAVTNVGVVTSQGDRAMRADVARATFGVDGTGVKVGVLSDSFNCKGGAAADVANNDLSPVTVLQEDPGCASGTDEGRAMLQIIHDVAPGAALAFATANGGMANFANNIMMLRDAGARVIVDDVIYLAEPMFQDGIIAQTVDAVVASGVAYFSAAGNYARQAYDHAFVPGTVFAAGAFPSTPGVLPFLGGTAHDFGGGTPFQRIAFPGGTSLILSLQWDSPFFSVSGNPGTQNDLDIYVLDSTGTRVVAAVTTNNLVSKDPVEVLNGVSCSPTVVQCVGLLMIVNHAGPNPGRIKYTLFKASPNLSMDFATNSGSIYGHANAAGAIAVGAADYRKTPAFGVSPAVLESFSSAGTTPILFDTSGNRLDTPDPRATKPEIVAPDRADTSFFGSGDPDGTGFLNFAGTSAAAPHAAAVAALMLQARPTLTPAQIRAALESTALDMGAAGFDNDTGFGLIQADAALASVGRPAKLTTVTADKAPPQVVGTTITFTATATGGTPPYQFKWWVYDGTMWTMAQDWNAGATFAWTPSVARTTYQISAWVRSSDNLTEAFESYLLTSFAITPPPPATITAVTMDKSAPQPPGTTITFTASATGGRAPYQFKWWVYDGTMWTIAQDWSASPTFAWTPSVANPAGRLSTWVRSSGNVTDAFESYLLTSFAISAPPPATPPSPATITAVTADKSAPQPAGTTITFTATATGGAPPYQFKWWVYDGTTWTIARDWSASPTFAWTPSVASPAAQLSTWVRSSGSTTDIFESYQLTSFAITPPPSATPPPVTPSPPATITVVMADKSAPQPSGTTVTFTATATGGTPPYQFKWWVYDGTTWTIAQDWSASPTFAWAPSVANAAYRLSTWVRSSGNVIDVFESYQLTSFAISAPPPATLTAVAADKSAPQPPGTTITFTATATGGTPPYQFKWWVYDGTTWMVAQDWSASPTFVWTPSVANPAGRLSTWVRSSGNTTDTFESYKLTSFAITPLTQVRFLNNLLICNPTCVSFTARLTAAEGYTWLSTSGTPSAYQVVTTPTLSNFTGEAIGFGASLTFPGTFTLVAGRRYELVATVGATAGSLILLLFDEGLSSASVPQHAETPTSALPGRWPGDPAIQFAPASQAPVVR